MKKLINLIVLVLVISAGVFISFGYAQVSGINIGDPIHLYRDGELTGTYTGLTQAVNEAESGDIINLIEDISVSTASVVSGKALTINGNNHTLTRVADVTTITVNDGSSLKLQDITITDNAVNFAPNRYNSLLTAKSNIPLCLGGVTETVDESGEVTASVCSTSSVDTAKTHTQIYSNGDIYGDNLTISNSLNSKGSAAIVVEKGGIEMINSNFIHNGASGTSNAGRGGAVRIGPNTATNVVDQSPITKIIFLGCLFESNYARNHGGALSLQYAPETITIDDCIFSGNTAYGNGGAIHIPNIWSNPGGYLPQLPNESTFPVGTLYINNSNFYNNWCGNDGSSIENDDLIIKVDSSNFEHNYGTQPGNTSVGVISCQVAGANRRLGRGLIWRDFEITNSYFKDTNTVVLGDHGRVGGFVVDNCVFEDQGFVLLTYHGVGEIKNSTIKNSIYKCGLVGNAMRDVDISVGSDYFTSWVPYFGRSVFKLENNTYSNDCDLNEYYQVRIANNGTGIDIHDVIVENEDNTRLFIHRRYNDSANIEGTDEIYYGATIDDGKIAYIKKNKFYDFDAFNTELKKLSFSNSGYQLESGKAMLFYLDSGYIQLWSGSISTTTNLYKKETDIYNITYEGMDGVNFGGITHTYKFINLDYTQYLSELTPYMLSIPSKNGYRFEGWFLDSGYTVPVTSIEVGTTGDIILYAKREELGYSGGGGGGGNRGGSSNISNDEKIDSNKNDSDNDEKADSFNEIPQNDNGTQLISPTEASEGQNDSQGISEYSDEFQQAYEFAKGNGITTMSTIQKADMNGKLTRIAMAKMLSQYAINILGMKPDEAKNNKFNDVSDKLNSDYDNGVDLAYQLGIMGQNMPNNKFRPDDEVTRAEFATALSRMLYKTSDGEYKSTPKYYIHHMEKLVEEGVITKDDPNMKELRGYVMIMLMRSTK